jgi:hypothetical protein
LRRGNHASPGRKHCSGTQGAHSPCRFLATDADALRYSENNLIRSALEYQLRREHADFVVTAFLNAQRLCSNPAKVELASMLPGFRFLLTAIVLSLSILVFGLGAAALLRAAHEEFASNPSWHAAPETTFAQGEATRPILAPVLALLRVDTPVVETPKIETPKIETPSAEVPAASAGPAEQAAISSAAEPEKVAALKPEESPPPEPAKPAIRASESPAQSEAAATPADAPATVDQTKIATAAEILPPANEAAPVAAAGAPAAVEQTPAAASPDPGVAATKIATLGGPPVTIGPQPPGKVAGAKPDRSVNEKRLHARRVALRRRMAARARLARQALLQQQAANPFLQPAIQPGVQPAIQPTNR